MANTALRVTELDFHSIKNNLKNYLRSQNQFQDYDFEGSGMSVLLDILAYNTHMMGYYLNVVANEMFLDTAQLRDSVISHAKAINYIPESRHGALVTANVIVTPSVSEDQNVATLTLDKYTRFLGKDIDGVNYPFVTLYSNTVAKNASSFVFNDISLKQGEVITLQYQMDPTNTSRRFKIPSANVDIDTVVITVQESSSNTTRTEYKIAEDITELTPNSAVYFIEEDQESRYTFYFGDDVLGKKPSDGNIISVTYLDTVGAPANNISRFYLTDAIGGLFNDNVSVTSVNGSYGGTDKETIEQIRYRAPYFYAAQNRAVTKNDYEILITKDYTNIDSVAVWGGEDNDPIVYGKVYLSLKTKNNYVLTNIEKERIKSQLIETRNVMTVTPEIVDPDYVFIVMQGNVYYNPSLTNKTTNEIWTLVNAAVQDYNNNELNKFSSTFRKSKLQYYIENADPSITGSDVDIYLQKRIALDTTQAKQYQIKFNVPLKKGDYNNNLYTLPQINVYDYNGVERQIYYEEVPLSATGIDGIDVLNAGINYTSSPTVTITGDGSGATAEAVVRAGRIVSINVTNRGSNYTRAIVTLSGGGGSEARAIARLEAKAGLIRSYYFNTNGTKSIINNNAGTINYETGEIIVTSLFANSTVTSNYYDTDVVTFNAPAENEVISPLRNRILAIDLNDPTSIQLEMVAES